MQKFQEGATVVFTISIVKKGILYTSKSYDNPSIIARSLDSSGRRNNLDVRLPRTFQVLAMTRGKWFAMTRGKGRAMTKERRLRMTALFAFIRVKS